LKLDENGVYDPPEGGATSWFVDAQNGSQNEMPEAKPKSRGKRGRAGSGTIDPEMESVLD
jgi:hypothetical protein